MIPTPPIHMMGRGSTPPPEDEVTYVKIPFYRTKEGLVAWIFTMVMVAIIVGIVIATWLLN